MTTGDPLTVTRGGVALQAYLHGAGAGPLVAFVHGGFLDRHMFDGQIGPLVGAGHPVLTWDLRGHGESGARGPHRPSVAELSADLLAVLEATGHTAPAVLVGQPLGGMIAQHVALTAPERVARLVTIGAPCINPDDDRLRRRAAMLWRVSGLVTGLLPTSLIRSQLVTGTAVTPEARDYVRSVVDRVTKDDFRWLVEASRDAGRGLGGRRITVRQLITRGERDTSGAGRLTALTAAHWVARDPDARSEVIPDAGHQAHQDNPEVFHRLLLDFLADPTGTGAADTAAP